MHSFNPLLFTAFIAAAGAGCSGGGGGAEMDGGTVRDAAPGDAGPIARLTLDELVHGCVRASACGIQPYPALKDCVAAYQNLYLSLGTSPIYDTIYRCVNAAKGDCQAVAKCFGRGGACDQSYKATCNGKVAVSCDLISKRVFELDCAVAGLECVIKTGQTAIANCARGTCDSSYQDQCEGNIALSCGGGVIEMRRCDELGEICGTAGWKTKTHDCKGETDDKCSNFGKWTYAPYCDKNIAHTCVGDRVHREDCSRHKLLTTACSGGQCVPAGTACSGVNRCNGDFLESCMDGKWIRYDCKALGLGPCKPATTHGANCSDPAMSTP